MGAAGAMVVTKSWSSCGWPKAHMNLEQWRLHMGSPALPQQTHNVHHALAADAKWLQQAWLHLDGLTTNGLHHRQTQRKPV
jgi:hypothetical protein